MEKTDHHVEAHAAVSPPEILALRAENEKLKDEIDHLLQSLAGLVTRCLKRWPELDTEKPQ